MNFGNMEIDNKKYLNILIIGLILIIIYVILFSASFLIPRVYSLSSDTIVDDDNEIKNGISRINVGKKIIELEGWAYKENDDVKTYECYFILKGHDNEKMYILKTINKPVEALRMVDYKYNCLNSGMYTKSLILGIRKGLYDLYILYENNGENILTNTRQIVEIK